MSSFESFIQAGTYLKNWSPKTVRSYQQAWASFQQSLRGAQRAGIEPATCEEPSVLTKTQLEAWVIWMRAKGMSPGGRNAYIRGLNSFLTWLHTEHEHPRLRVRLLKKEQKAIQAFSDSDIRLLLSFRPKAFTELRTWTLITLLLDTGCRIDEVINLSLAGIDFDNLQIVVIGKGSKQRRIPLSVEARKHLFRLKAAREKRQILSQHFFCCRNGTRLMYRNVVRDAQALCKKAGLQRHVNLHAFRHCFAVTYIRRGGDIYRLSRILGHTSISTTQIYLRSMGIEQVAENHSELTPLALR